MQSRQQHSKRTRRNRQKVPLMIALACDHSDSKRFGRDKAGNQRHRCKACGKTWIESAPKLLGDMRLPLATAELCLRMLLEGNSLRSTARLTGVSRATVIALLMLVGR